MQKGAFMEGLGIVQAGKTGLKEVIICIVLSKRLRPVGKCITTDLFTYIY